ncbi:hypothetical protein PoB_005693700 [Plakobranchus ocellatus]|uniref:Uncharacterized protein n=1 Tax=Plakobranchus ocellatus TaxID=259542 RepID=A0AAV4CFR5_9GAST|nr:hypothetical protein PoB_005693700 [Plakobranchus ocellatus]
MAEGEEEFDRELETVGETQRRSINNFTWRRTDPEATGSLMRKGLFIGNHIVVKNHYWCFLWDLSFNVATVLVNNYLCFRLSS